jgi:hypothetical protein
MEYSAGRDSGAYDDPGAIENVLFSGDFPDCRRIRPGTQTIPPKRSRSRDASETIHTHLILTRKRRRFDMHQNILPSRYRQKKKIKNHYRIAEPAISTPFTSDPALFTACRGLSCSCMQAKKAVFPNFFRDH